MRNPRPRCGFTLLELVVVLVVIVILVAILMPLVQSARESARRTQSRNNLKQIGLALFNYESAYGMLPPGGVFDAEGMAFHGWMTSITPYIDASPFYNRVNFNIPWDDPIQIEHFLSGYGPVYVNPSVPIRDEDDGIVRTHYAGSDLIFYHNSSTRLSDLTNGLAQTLCVGDAKGNFEPFGYPYNWRDVSLGLNTSPDGFGCSVRDVTQMMIADGSVREFNHKTDGQLFLSLKGVNKKWNETPGDVSKPPGPYRLRSRKMWTTVKLASDRETYWSLTGRKNPEGELISARFESMDKDWHDVKLPLDAELKSLKQQTSLQTFDGYELLSDAGLKILAELPNLQSLKVGGQWITDAGMESISKMTSLQDLSITNSQITDEGVPYLLKLPRLKILEFSAKNLSGEGIATLASLAGLEKLELHQTELHKDRLRDLSKLPRLKSLILNDVGITEDDLETLSSFSSLHTLELRWWKIDPQISEDSVAHLREMMPETEITMSDWSMHRRSTSGRTQSAATQNLPADATQPANSAKFK
ncbi:MAG: DUF1559 domain-containing protein [Planctomycetaceae bacterium]